MCTHREDLEYWYHDVQLCVMCSRVHGQLRENFRIPLVTMIYGFTKPPYLGVATALLCVELVTMTRIQFS